MKELSNITFHHHEEHEHSHEHHHEHEHGGCGCGHCHHDHEENENHVALFVRLGISLVLLAALMVSKHFFAVDEWFFQKISITNEKLKFLISLSFYLVPYLVAGYDILWSAIKNIFHGELLDEEFLMAVATVGALAIGEFPEAVFVMIFYQVGEFFSDYASEKTRTSVSKLMDIAPEFATIKNENGEFVQVEPGSIAVGTLIYVKPGERIPLDGVIVEGETSLDTSALTGESLPRSLGKDEEVFSGSINLTSLITVKTTKVYEDSTVSKILELVEHAESKKSRAENFITKFARVYTPCVVALAIAIAVLPPVLRLIIGVPENLAISSIWQDWIHRALIFLVVSCPCALVISVPLSFFVGIGESAKHGILVKGSNYLEALSQAKICVFDKTGTLTKGSFSVIQVLPSDETEEKELLHLAFLAEKASTHPISLSVVEYCKANGINETSEDEKSICEVNEIAGCGLCVLYNGKELLCGNEKLMKKENVTVPQEMVSKVTVGTSIFVAYDGKFCGLILVADKVKEKSAETISELKKLGVKETVMLTGDKKEVAQIVAKDIGLDSFYAELFPEDKVDVVEEKLASLENTSSGTKNKSRGQLVFCGDGINDAPVLTRADIGISMGSLGSDAAIEASDVVIMDDDISKVPLSIEIARQTRKIATENIVLALGVKIGVLGFASFGLANMWLAIFADVGVCVLATVNAIRAGKTNTL